MLPNAVESVLNASSIIEELIVIDQSTDERSEKSIEQFKTDTRLKYVKDNRVGKGLALNTGLKLAQGDVVAITDDDCVVSKDWPYHLIKSFHDNQKVAVAFGNVYPAPYDPKDGFIPIYTITKDKHIRHMWGKMFEGGIGANMAVRKMMAIEIGGFDLELGPGGKFGACVDGDFALRSLIRGYEITNVAASSVVHYGFRDWNSGSKMIQNAFYGIGASYVKPLRCGIVGGLPVYMEILISQCILHVIGRTLSFRKPFGFHRLTSYLQGTRDGWRHPIDHKTLKYLSQRENN